MPLAMLTSWHALVVQGRGQAGTDRAGPGGRQRRGQRGDPDRASLRRPRHDHRRHRRQDRVRPGAGRRACRELPHAGLRRGDARSGRASAASTWSSSTSAARRSSGRSTRSPGSARSSRSAPTTPTGGGSTSATSTRRISGSSARTSARSSSSRTVLDHVVRGTAAAGRRPRVPAQGRARRRAARARPQEQGEGPPGLVTLGELLGRAALRRPDAEAVVDGRRRLTYAELDGRATRRGAGARLARRRSGRPRAASRSATAWSTWSPTGRSRSSARVAVPVNFRLAANELRYVLDDSGAKRRPVRRLPPRATMLEATSGTSVRRVFVGDPAPAGTIAFAEIAGGAAPVPALEPPSENDLSLILYTSGTTGRPKGVPRTHKNHYAGAMAHVIQCGYEWGERTLGVMPLYHTMGIHALTSMAAINGCFVCQPDWSSRSALQLIARERLTALYLIPTLFWELVHAPELARTDVSSVRKLAYAGAPMLAPLTEACAKAFGPRRLRESLRLDRDLHVLGLSGRPRQARLRRTARHPLGAAARGREHRAARRTRRGGAGRRPGRDHRESRRRTRRSPGTGTAPTPTPARCATAGTSPATWAGSTPTVTSGWPGAWTT